LRTVGQSNKAPSPQLLGEQIEKILRSNVFRNAPSLQRLLHFVTSKAAQDQSGQIKEYTIAAEVFGRGDNYDPKIDTTVRVEMRRLREKLRDYYETEGGRDPILIGIPKGRYLPTFEIRPESVPGYTSPEQPYAIAPAAQRSEGQVSEAELAHQPIVPARLVRPMLILGVVASLCLVLLGFALGVRWDENASQRRGGAAAAVAPRVGLPLDPVVEEFWRGILGNEAAPVVGYPAAVFLIDETNDLFRFRRGASDARGTPVDPHLALQNASNPLLIAKAGTLYYEDGYTGTGELEGIALLAPLFSAMNLQMALKRCNEITIDDLKKHNVVLLGSSFQNRAVAQLPSSGEFVFDNPEPRRELWRGRIINLHPSNGEEAVYRTERDPVTQVVKTDYALITVQQGVLPGRTVVILGGLDTTGSEGALQFVTSKSTLEQLFRRLKSLGAQAEQHRMPMFQALLRVELQNGQDVLNTQLEVVHIIGSN
jgi:hypothetical protein